MQWFSRDERLQLGRGFKFAFSDLLLCKKIRFAELVAARFLPTSFMRLPAMIHCKELDIVGLMPRLDRWLQLNFIEAHDVVE
ncbi:hypothetical protein AAVH_21895 [Aphelenchoides avenae]|nr:hypothetical protein AAVH_21895 [Aphelenchus avenae]